MRIKKINNMNRKTYDSSSLKFKKYLFIKMKYFTLSAIRYIYIDKIKYIHDSYVTKTFKSY